MKGINLHSISFATLQTQKVNLRRRLNNKEGKQKQKKKQNTIWFIEIYIQMSIMAPAMQEQNDCQIENRKITSNSRFI